MYAGCYRNEEEDKRGKRKNKRMKRGEFFLFLALSFLLVTVLMNLQFAFFFSDALLFIQCLHKIHQLMSKRDLATLAEIKLVQKKSNCYSGLSSFKF